MSTKGIESCETKFTKIFYGVVSWKTAKRFCEIRLEKFAVLYRPILPNRTKKGITVPEILKLQTNIPTS